MHATFLDRFHGYSGRGAGVEAEEAAAPFADFSSLFPVAASIGCGSVGAGAAVCVAGGGELVAASDIALRRAVRKNGRRCGAGRTRAEMREKQALCQKGDTVVVFKKCRNDTLKKF